MTDDQTTDGGSLSTITRGASLYFIGKIVSNALKVIFNLVLTRTLGSTLYGVYTLGYTILSFFMILSRMGTGQSLLRFLPNHRDDSVRRNWYVSLAYGTAIVGSVIVGLALYVSAPLINEYTLQNYILIDTLRIFAVLLPFHTLIQLTNAVFRALERLEYQVVVADVVEPTLQISAVSAAFLLGYSLLGAVAGLAIASLLTVSVGITLLYARTDVRPTRTPHTESIRKFYDFSIPLTMKDLGELVYKRVDILMVGFFLTGSAVGVYRAALLVPSLLTLPLTAISQLFPPVASNLYAEGELEELESVYSVTTRWVFTAILCPALAVIVYRNEVLRIFGEDFATGGGIIALLTIAQMSNCAVGASGYLLMMTDNQYMNLYNQWLLGISNVVLNYVLIEAYGLVGAAMATAGVLAAINVLRVVEVWYLERMTPYTRSYWKPLISGAVAGTTMYGMQFVLSGYPLLVGGSFLGLLVYAVTIFAVGIEREDMMFYEENVQSRVEWL